MNGQEENLWPLFNGFLIIYSLFIIYRYYLLFIAVIYDYFLLFVVIINIYRGY